jgi:hypothetical protein
MEHEHGLRCRPPFPDNGLAQKTVIGKAWPDQGDDPRDDD